MDGALFPDREAEWDDAARGAERKNALAEFRRYCREVMRADVGGLVSVSVAGRCLGMRTESFVRHLVNQNLLREFRYPTLKMVGIPVKDILRVKAELERAARKEGGAE